VAIVLDASKIKTRRLLIAALRPLARRDTRNILQGDQAPLISAFVTRRRETISESSMPAAGLVVVIEGRKQVSWGARRRVYAPGEAFVFPAGSRFDVVNEPDEKSGAYRALFVRFSRELVIEAARRWPQLTSQNLRYDMTVAMEPALCSAIIHAGETLGAGFSASRRLLDHRILEVLLILAEQGALPIAPKYVETSVADGIRLLIRHRLDHPWSAALVASELSMSEATLRRRLRQEGQTLRAILLAERMQAARTILHDRDADVADAVAATGYTSRSHFSRHFQEAFGAAPSVVRKGRKQHPVA
jgi:AraC-like DNA-binding protein